MDEKIFLRKIYFRIFNVEALSVQARKEKSGPLPAGEKYEKVLDERIARCADELKFLNDFVEEAIG